jgi:hypothetical protein
MRGDPSESRLKMEFDARYSNQMHNTESRLRDSYSGQDPNCLAIKIKKKSKLPAAKKSNRQRFKAVETNIA